MDLGGEDAAHRHYLAALLDAESAIELDSEYPKAYLRKGQALVRLGRYDEAKAAAEAGESKVARARNEAVGAELKALVEEIERLQAGPQEHDLFEMD